MNSLALLLYAATVSVCSTNAQTTSMSTPLASSGITIAIITEKFTTAATTTGKPTASVKLTYYVKPTIGTKFSSAKNKINVRVATPRPATCHKENFGLLNECCKEQIPALFKVDTRHKCMLSWNDAKVTNAFNVYRLNRWPQIIDTATPVITRRFNMMKDPQGEILSDLRCYTECLFRTEGLLLNPVNGYSFVNATLNVDKLAQVFKESLLVDNADNKMLVQKALDTCIPIVPVLVASALQKEGQSSCSLLPFVLLQCIKREILLTCNVPPVPEGKVKGFSLGDQCDMRRKWLKTCYLV